MIRLTALWLLVFGTVAYAWVDWFKSLLVLVLLMAIYQHPDMPKELAGIQGMNPWNVMMAGILMAWLFTRSREGYRWDMPAGTMVLIAAYLTVMFVSSLRALADPETIPATMSAFESSGQLIGELLINTFKWILPMFLLFDGIRDQRRLKQALFCILAIYALIAVQVAKYMPPQYAVDGDELAHRAIRVLEHGVGYHRVNLSVMLAGASWAIFATRALVSKRANRALVPILALLVVYAQAMTAGRAGYVTWGCIGLTLCVLKWRRYLLAVPLVVVAIVTLAPGVRDRMLAGFSADTKDSNALVDKHNQEADRSLDFEGEGGGPDAYTVTSGRTFIWPFVIEKIQQSPWIGYGRLAMFRTGLVRHLLEDYRELFPHPHNAYLELVFDNGIIGALCVLPFVFVVLWRSMVMLLDKRSPEFVAAGGACLAVLLSHLYGSFGSQSFYPTEGWFGMWCLFGVMLRVSVQRTQAVAALKAFASKKVEVRPARMVSARARREPPPPVAAPPSMSALLWTPPTLAVQPLSRTA